MKLTVKPELLKSLALCAGGLGLMLRIILYTTGLDEKGLLVSGHWAGISLCVLTAVVIAGLFLLTRTIQDSKDQKNTHPASVPAGIGAFAAAFSLAYCTVSELGTQSLLYTVLNFAATLSLVFIAVSRLKNMTPHFVCHTLLCVFFALRMVGQYQHWNSDPQLLDYCFYLGAYVTLMLTAYQHAALDSGMGSHRNLWCLSLISVYLCMVSLKDSADALLLLGTGIWALTNLTDLNSRPRRQRPTLELNDDPSRKEV